MNHKIQIFITIITLFFLFTRLTNAQINTEKLRKDTTKQGFSGRAGAEFGLNAGNSNYLSANGNLRLDYLINKVDFFLVSNYDYKEGNNQKIINQGFTHLRCDISLNPKLFLEFFTQKEFNDFISLKDRNLAGSGLRFDVLNYISGFKDDAYIKIFLGIGAMFENEVYDAVPSQITKNLIRSTSYLDIYWQPDSIFTLSLVNYFQPYVLNINNFRWLADTNLEFKINKTFSFSTHFTLRYDNRPVINIKKYDIELTNGIAVSF